jgi:hypothetical protein
MQESNESLERLNGVLGCVLEAQQKFAVKMIEMEDARARRDQAIIDAAAAGFPRRSLAEMTSLTPGRVQQIVDAARDRPNLQPALRMERERRQRSQQLAELAREYARRQLEG